MKKKTIKRSTLFNMKGIVYLAAFAIWVIILMDLPEEISSVKDFISAYGSNILVIISFIYIAIVLLEFFVDIER